MTKAELIRQMIEALPQGQPFTPAKFLSVAERSTIDKSFARLVKAGVLSRPTRGIFVRPRQSKFGAIPPSSLEIALAKAHGEPIGVHGAEAVRRFGLSTQVPVRPVFYTTGRTRTFYVGPTPVRLQHVCPRKLVLPGTTAGLAISALWYLGKEEVSNEAFEKIRCRMSEAEFEQLKAAAPLMPIWMANSLHRYEKGRLDG